jgi:hypothetical protein
VIRASTSGAKNLGAPEYACAVCPFDDPFVSVFFSLRQFIYITGLSHISYFICHMKYEIWP